MSPEADPAQVLQFNPQSREYVLRKVFPAGDWALNETENSRALVGKGDQILWAKGEPFITCGDTSHGKSTFDQNIMRGSIGLIEDVIGLAVSQFKHVLYVAADRPSQIKYSVQRMVNEGNRGIWNQRVHMHEGPLDFTLNEAPFKLLPWIRDVADKLEQEPFDCVFLDSLKDLVSAMDENTEGIHINQAFQSVCQQGIELGVMVHPRKLGGDRKSAPILDDVGGSKQIVNGAGSVIFLGSPDENNYQQLYHLKPPAERISNVSLRFEKKTGNIDWLDAGVI